MDLFLGAVFILIAHFIADFVFQSDNMAIKKSYNIQALLLHIFVYTTTFFIMFSLYGVILNIFTIFTVSIEHWIQIGIGISIVNGILHYITDYCTSRIGKHYWEKEQRRNFFLTIGIDQLLHTSLLIYCYAEMLQNFGYI